MYGTVRRYPARMDDSAAMIDLLGALAYGELSAYFRLSADAAAAPSLPVSLALAGLATRGFERYRRIEGRLLEHGADPAAAMEPFVPVLREYHDRTQPADWLEGLVKAFVGDGIAADFNRELAAFADEETRALVDEVLVHTEETELVVSTLREAIAAEPEVADRLALWGRRLVGEAIAGAQRVALERDDLADLLVGRPGQPGADLAELGLMLARITRAHQDRMARLGFAS